MYDLSALCVLLVLRQDCTIASLALTLRLFAERSVFLVKVQSHCFVHGIEHLCSSVDHLGADSFVSGVRVESRFYFCLIGVNDMIAFAASSLSCQGSVSMFAP